MITVGKHNNLRVYKATKNDKGTLVIGIKQEKPAGSALDFLNASTDNTSSGGRDQDFLIYGPKATDFNGNPDTSENNLKKVQETKDMLTHILLNYMTSDKIQWDILANTTVTAENLATEFCKQEVLDKVYDNMCNQFIDLIRPFLAQTNKLYRMIFPRKSKQSHFPRLRNRYLDSNPFMESMEIPETESKLKFTKWELEQGYDSPEKIESNDSGSEETANITSSVFNR